MSLLVDIGSQLTGITSNIYYSDMPDTPDNNITLYNTGGFDTLHSLGNITAEQPTFQVAIRHTSYATAITWAESVKGILNPLIGSTINSNLYISVFMQGDINSLGKDDRNRSKITLNFVARVKRA